MDRKLSLLRVAGAVALGAWSLLLACWVAIYMLGLVPLMTLPRDLGTALALATYLAGWGWATWHVTNMTVMGWRRIRRSLSRKEQRCNA